MATKEAIRQFYATNSKKQTKVKVGGKFSFNKLPEDIKMKIKEKLASKDKVMDKGLKGELPGLKINGKQVTRDNIHEFEKKPEKSKKAKTKKSASKKSTSKKITEKIKKIVKKKEVKEEKENVSSKS